MKDREDYIFKIIQGFLEDPPVIIWGSGATVPFGLPTMDRLNEKLKLKVDIFDTSSTNLEVELGKEKYNSEMPKIREVIHEEIAIADKQALNDLLVSDKQKFQGIKRMIELFREPHPRVVNIITTNYDRILEYVFAFYDIPFTDGSLGKKLSAFDSSLFRDKDIVNLIKVHGSLNWLNIDGETRISSDVMFGSIPQIICPGKNKYQEAYNNPYRELIQKSDLCINCAKSFLVIGFGFNDEHLTPRIKAKIKKGTPIVVITKKITDTCKSELKNAEKYILIEESSNDATRVIVKEKNSEEEIMYLEKNYWSLNCFMEIF